MRTQGERGKALKCCGAQAEWLGVGFGRGRVSKCGMGWDGRKGVGQWGRVGMVCMGCVMIGGVFGGGSLACLWFSIFWWE